MGHEFWDLRLHLQAFGGPSLADALLRRAGREAGAALARDLGSTALPSDPRAALADCLGALAAPRLGRGALQELEWPLGRATVTVSDSFEAALAAAQGPAPDGPCCAYLAGVLEGIASTVAGRGVSCRETECAAAGASLCRFELTPAEGAQPLPAGIDADTGQRMRLLEILFSHVPMGIAIFDRKLKLRRCNPTWTELLRRYAPGMPMDVWPGGAAGRYTAEAQARYAAALADVMAGHDRRYEALRMVIDGEISYWDILVSPLFGTDEVEGLVLVVVDATERVLARQELEARVAERTREIERRRQVAEGLRDILGILNSDCTLTEAQNAILAQARRILGSDACSILLVQDEDRGLAFAAHLGLPPDYVGGPAIPWGRGVSGTAVARRQPVFECDLSTHLDPDANKGFTPEQRDHVALLVSHYRAMLSAPLVIRSEAIGALALYYRAPREFDAEEVDLAFSFADQVALAIDNARLQASIQEQAASDERNRLARELHDAVSQTLFSASLMVDVLPRLYERSPEQALSKIEELRLRLRGALAEMRSLLLELHPAALVRSRLPDLLQQLAEASSGRALTPVHLTVQGSPAELPQDVRTALYRIAQEALNNATRHAGATAIEVDLAYCPAAQPEGIPCVRLLISDDGRGFAPDGVAPGHLGLQTMRERADGIGARLSLFTDLGAGTRVTVTWPGVAPKGMEP